MKTADCKKDFQQEQREVVWTDGAMKEVKDNGNRAAWAIFFGSNDSLNEEGPLPGGQQTRIRAEIFAIVKAVEKN